jgi:DNA-binding CsgD family transcriptional regulator
MRRARRADRTAETPAPPAELTAHRLTVGGNAIAVLSFPVPALELPATLTPAEEAVVRLVLEGRSNAEVARRRGASPRTVANQLASAYAKLGVTGRAGLVRLLRPGAR